MIPSGYQNNGKALPGTVGQTNDGWSIKRSLNNIKHDRQLRKRKCLS